MAGDFSDEDWDLSDDELQLLEREAIRSTQQQAHVTNKSNGRKSAEKPFVSSTRRGDAPVVSKFAATNGQNHTLLHRPSSELSSTENVSLDEDGVPLVIEEAPRRAQERAPKRDETTLRERWRTDRFRQNHTPASIPAQGIVHNTRQQHQQSNARASSNRGPAEAVREEFAQGNAVPVQVDVHTQLAQLQKEKEVLIQSLDQVRNELQTARGEITIIRSKSVTDARSTDREVNILKKQMQEELQRHQTTLQAKDAAYKQLVSDKNFLKHDLDEQARLIKLLQTRSKEETRSKQSAQQTLSPRKRDKFSLRDGFDDDEIMLNVSPGPSPAKNRKESKPSTPSNRKRKQQQTVDDEPLALYLSFDPVGERVNQDRPHTNRDESKAVKDLRAEQHLQLIQNILQFRPADSQDTLIEQLVQYAFPSKPEQSIGAILLTETSRLNREHLPKDLLQIMVNLIKQVVREKYYLPLAAFLATVSHILKLEPTVVDADVLNGLIPPLQELADINARRRWLLYDRAQVWTNENPRPVLNPHVSTTFCLQILFNLAALVLDEPKLIDLFWRLMGTDIVLLFLWSCQDPDDIFLMFDLLETSILPETFGNICSAGQQHVMETYILDKVCFLLWDKPKPYVPPPVKQRFPQYKPDPDPAGTPCSRHDLCKFRLRVVGLLAKFATSSIPHPHTDKTLIERHHGTTALVNHQNALARLVRALYDEVDNLYACLPTHHLHAQLVNRQTAILHHCLTAPQASTINLYQKLTATLGGVHKFRVVLTRLAFRDGTYIDRGVTERTMEMAREILEEYVTPDEAVALLDAFGLGSVEPDADAEEQTEDGTRNDESDEEIMAGIE